MFDRRAKGAILASTLLLTTVGGIIASDHPGFNHNLLVLRHASCPSLPLNHQSDGISISAPQSERFPLRVEAGKRLLVDASGRGFLLHGDTAWSLIAQLSKDDVITYLDDRKARGFNAILVNLLEAKFASKAPKNFYGDCPFSGAEDYARPNEKYFKHVDWVLQQAARRGILVLLAPSYLGYGGGNEGWYEMMAKSGPYKLKSYGRFLGNRYKNFTNILWVHAGDFNPPEKALVNAIAEGIREKHSAALHTSHGDPETSPLDLWSSARWLTVNNIYTYKDVFASGVSQYNRSKMPFFLIESKYEGEQPGSSPHQIRVQAYQALLSGATGHVFGNNPIWHFDGPGQAPPSQSWQEALKSPGSRSMEILHRLMSGLPWEDLQPDLTGEFITDGNQGEGRRAVAAVSRNPKIAVVYIPTSQLIRLDLRPLQSDSLALSWYDPSTGATNKPVIKPGSKLFITLATPGLNGESSEDWVLLVREK